MTMPPVQVNAEVSAAASRAHTLWREITMRKNWSIKNVERVLAYLAGLIAATNGFGDAGMPTSIRTTLLVVSGVILAAIHVSTPKV